MNDTRLRGLSVTYEDLARLVVQEAGPPAGCRFRGGSRVGVESPRAYFRSIPASVLGIVRWQLRRWQAEREQGEALPGNAEK